MHQSRLRHLLDILKVPLRTVLSERLPILDENKETEDLHDAGRSRDDEAVLISVERIDCQLMWNRAEIVDDHLPEIGDPRSHPIPDGETHRVPDQDDRHNRLSPELAIAVNTVRNRYLQSDSIRQGNKRHSENQAKPLNMVSSSHSP